MVQFLLQEYIRLPLGAIRPVSVLNMKTISLYLTQVQAFENWVNFLFHHDPDATDEQLNERQFLAQQLFPNTTVAREGLRIPLSQFVESGRGQRGTPN